MTDDLIERLRARIVDTLLEGLPYNRDGAEAADRIEALSAENAALKAAQEDDSEMLTIAWMDGAHRSTKAHRERVKELEAENERLREKLMSIMHGAENGEKLFADRQGNRAKPIWYAVNVLQDHLSACKGTARAALAGKEEQ